MATPSFEPAPGRILLEKIDESGEKVTDSGIIIPDTGDRKNIIRGRVASEAGGGYLYGDVVAFTPYAGYTLSIDGNEYVLVDEMEILGVFR